MSFRIFISYRREESVGHAARLAERLRGDYDQELVFFDQSAVKGGEPFPQAIKEALNEAEVVLAVIGPKWLSCKSVVGKRRLEEKKDWVREELRRALQPQRGGEPRLVIPVLVQGASMPRKDQLPETVAGLAERQALALPDAGPGWQVAYQTLLSRVDEKLRISPEERARYWVYDDIASRLEPLSENQRRNVALELSKLDGRSPGTAFSARALAKRFYRIGPSAMESLRQSLRFDASLRPVLERLKDYWVTNEASTTLARTWVTNEPCRATIVQGNESAFTPDCIVQKASNAMTPWLVKPVVSGASQPCVATVISDIHGWLRRVFADSLRRARLPDVQEEGVTLFLQQRLAEKARSGRPLAVQLDETGAADNALVRSIQSAFPHLRLLVLAMGPERLRDLEEKYFADLEKHSMTVVIPEATPGDEHRAAESYYRIVEDFPSQ